MVNIDGSLGVKRRRKEEVEGFFTFCLSRQHGIGGKLQRSDIPQPCWAAAMKTKDLLNIQANGGFSRYTVPHKASVGRCHIHLCLYRQRITEGTTV